MKVNIQKKLGDEEEFPDLLKKGTQKSKLKIIFHPLIIENHLYKVKKV